MLDVVNLYLGSRGIRITTGTIVDATIIHAPSSTKNEKKERDPEMHQTKKGNQWYFGANAHIGVDSREGVVYSVCTSAASVSDVHMLPDLLHDQEKKGVGRCGLSGADCGDSSGRARSTGYDQPPREDEGGHGRRAEAQEPYQSAGAGQGGVSLRPAKAWAAEM